MHVKGLILEDGHGREFVMGCERPPASQGSLRLSGGFTEGCAVYCLASGAHLDGKSICIALGHDRNVHRSCFIRRRRLSSQPLEVTPFIMTTYQTTVLCIAHKRLEPMQLFR